MKYFYTPLFIRKLNKTKKNNKKLAASLKDTLEEFDKDPKQNSLRLHKLSGNMSTAWSISVDKDIRIIFQYVPEGIILINFGKHQEVY